MSRLISVEIEDGRLVVSVSIENLGPLALSGRFFDDPERGAPIITDAAAFAAAIRSKLREERESGETAVHRMLDDAARAAYEYGCEGLEWPDTPHSPTTRTDE